MQRRSDSFSEDFPFYLFNASVAHFPHNMRRPPSDFCCRRCHLTSCTDFFHVAFFLFIRTVEEALRFSNHSRFFSIQFVTFVGLKKGNKRNSLLLSIWMKKARKFPQFCFCFFFVFSTFCAFPQTMMHFILGGK